MRFPWRRVTPACDSFGDEACPPNVWPVTRGRRRRPSGAAAGSAATDASSNMPGKRGKVNSSSLATLVCALDEDSTPWIAIEGIIEIETIKAPATFL